MYVLRNSDQNPKFYGRPLVRRRREIGPPQRGTLSTHGAAPSVGTPRRHRVPGRAHGNPLRALPQVWFGPRFREAPFRLRTRLPSLLGGGFARVTRYRLETWRRRCGRCFGHLMQSGVGRSAPALGIRIASRGRQARVRRSLGAHQPARRCISLNRGSFRAASHTGSESSQTSHEPSPSRSSISLSSQRSASPLSPSTSYTAAMRYSTTCSPRASRCRRSQVRSNLVVAHATVNSLVR